MRKQKHSISAFFPAYNDGYAIEKMVKDVLSVLRKVTDDYEVIVVDDASVDDTGRIADGLARKYRNVRVIHHKQNRGYGGALKTGFASARKELVFYTDGDAQYDAKELARLVPLINGADVVNGYKIKRHDALYRIFFGWLYKKFVRVMFNLRIKDVDCDFRLFRKSVLDKVSLESDSGVICVELMKKVQLAGARIVETPVHHYPRLGGGSQFFRVRKIMAVFLGLAKHWWRLVVERNLGGLVR
jgi:glycosyltransferase involved in cell wall biosynthesis